MTSGRMSPNQREILSARSTVTNKQEYLTSTNGALNTTATISAAGVATSDNQTNGTQKTQIVDAGGEAATVTGGKLDVNATASLAGTALPISGATEAVGVAIVDSSGNQISSFGGGTQYAEGTTTDPATGTVALGRRASDAGLSAIRLDSNNRVEIVAADPLQVDNANFAEINGKIPALGQALMAASTPVVIASNQSAIPVSQSGAWDITNISGTVSLPTGAATAALQTQPGVDIGDVTVNNASGAAAVNIQDGGNSITVDGSVTANAGTNLNTSALALESGGNLATLAGTVTAAVLQGNVKQINGVTPLMGNGGTGTGSQRVTIASDNTAFSVNATLSAETTKVIGTVNQGTSPWVTSNATTSVVGNGAAATAQRVTLANDSTGVIATVGAVTAITNALPAGTNAIGKLAANSGVDIGDVDVTSVIAGTGATNIGKAEDAGHTTGDTGVFALGVRNDTLADVTNTTADYSQLSTDLKGRVMTAGAPRALKGTAQVALSNTTSETTIIAATASTFHDVYGLILANTGATTTKVSIRDDTAGTVRAIIEVPTLETRGFMLPVDSAMPQTATNKNWTAQCGSATTALEVTAFYVSMV